MHTGNARHLLPGALLRRFSTEPAATADEEPIKPPVEVKHTQLFINGSFVDAASGYTVRMNRTESQQIHVDVQSHLIVSRGRVHRQ
jgi:hypothetical protein